MREQVFIAVALWHPLCSTAMKTKFILAVAAVALAVAAVGCINVNITRAPETKPAPTNAVPVAVQPAH